MKSYLYLARKDLETAEILLNSTSFGHIARLCQQYVEKIMKFRIDRDGDTEDFSILRTHKIKRIAKRCEELADLHFTESEMLFFGDLSDFYFDTNYPTDDYFEVDRETAADVYQKTIDFKQKYEETIIKENNE